MYGYRISVARSRPITSGPCQIYGSAPYNAIKDFPPGQTSQKTTLTVDCML